MSQLPHAANSWSKTACHRLLANAIMFGLDFFFASALFALPLAGLPILLHMLFRRKSPVVYFPTLRLIKASLQQTAARRRIQRWFLLACRILLLILLIWAISQPYIRGSSPFADAHSVMAAIVVDTSYSMLLREDETATLDKANDIISDLLRDQLKDAKVAIFRSQPPPSDKPEQPVPAAQIQSQWTPLKPQPAIQPLLNRCTSAINFLRRQQANQKWLVILTDLQSREFPSPLPVPEDVRVILFDLHPDVARSAGISSVRMEPDQPIPGIGCHVAIEVTGRAGDARALNLSVTRLDNTAIKQAGPVMARLDGNGRSRVRIPLPQGLPIERYLLAAASFQADDALAWDNCRAQVVELPPRQLVGFFDAPRQSAAANFIRLALDPWEGKLSAWPIQVKRVSDLAGNEDVAVLPLADWPDQALANRLRAFAVQGNTVLLLLQPGLEQSFPGLSSSRKSAILSLLPAELSPAPVGGGTAGSGVFRPVPPPRMDRVLEGLTDPSFRLDQLTVRRFVPFAAPSDSNVSTILHLSPVSGDSRTFSFGLLYRRSVGNGVVFTFATLPDSRYINPPTHPLFLPLLVSMSLRPPDQRDAQNVELGCPLVLTGNRYAAYSELDIQGPNNLRVRVRPVFDPVAGRRFLFADTNEPGLYYWRTVNDNAAVAIANVQLPAAESDLLYKPAESILPPGASCLVVRSSADLRRSIAKFSEPQRRWTIPLAVVLVLLCVEALLASVSELWKPQSLRSLFAGAAEQS